MLKFKDRAQQLLDFAGIRINGKRKYDIQVHNDDLYQRVFSQGSLGLGEAYAERWWDCEELDEFFYRVLSAELEHKIISIKDLLTCLKATLCNLQKPTRAFTIGEHHYDMGDDLYEAMLDKRMTYSCAYWKRSRSLDKAQENKLDLIFKKLGLKPGMRVLDIGCGWGGALCYAAEKYGVKGTGITVSRNQEEKAKDVCKHLPVEIHRKDYRNLTGLYDRIWSVGMIEHVGVKNYRTYMNVVKKCLKPEGLFLLHTIGRNRSVVKSDPWISKYIFPNSMIPSIRQLALSWEGLFVMEDWHNFGMDYVKTLKAWHNNVQKHRDALRKNYDNRFFRIWKYYLMCSAGAFKSRKLNLWQIVLSPEGVKGGYSAIR